MCPAPDDGAPSATLARRALALIYEALLLTAVVFIGSLPFVMFMNVTDHGIARLLFQLYLVALTGLYFGWQWRRGGQTLPMKTWRMRVVTRAGAPLAWGHALKRFAFALPGTLLFGAGFLWALVDREGLFLHDRLAGTRIIKEEDERRKEE
jgi:uncharacterized RDD family membrane protein YckC